MKIHYFFRREYSEGFYNLQLIAWLEEKETSRDGIARLSFKRLEKIRVFLSKRDYHDNMFEHDFGRDSCHGHYAHTRRELFADMKKWGKEPIDRKNYERFRKVVIALYKKTTLVDFSEFKGKQPYHIRTIIGD